MANITSVIRKETGMNVQDHIHSHLIKEAQYLLTSTNKIVNELAVDLDVDYPQYFSRLFKQKTSVTPNAYRAAQQPTC